MGVCVSSQSNDNTTKRLSEADASSHNSNDNSTTKLSHAVAESEVEFIAAIVIKISRDVSSMGKMIKKLGTSEDTEELRTHLDRIDHKIDQLIEDAGERIRELGLNGKPRGLQDELLVKLDHLMKSLQRYYDEKDVLQLTIEQLKMALRLKEDLAGIEARNKENLRRLQTKYQLQNRLPIRNDKTLDIK